MAQLNTTREKFRAVFDPPKLKKIFEVVTYNQQESLKMDQKLTRKNIALMLWIKYWIPGSEKILLNREVDQKFFFLRSRSRKSTTDS